MQNDLIISSNTSVKHTLFRRAINYSLKTVFNSELTFRKKLNLALSGISYSLRLKKPLNNPIKLTLDPSNFCNLHCKLCPTGTSRPGRTKAIMKYALFKKIIDDLGKDMIDIDLFNWGEPFLNPDIFKMISYAKKFKIKLSVSTNINHFNDSICKGIVSSGLDKLIVSLDGASQKSVSKYQQGMNFSKAVSNMKKIADMKKKLNSKTPHLQWRFLVNQFNESEIEKAKKIAKEIGVNELELGTFRCDLGQEIFMNNSQQYDSIKSWLPKSEGLSMYDYSSKQKKRLRSRCLYLWTQSTINPNGDVSPCCAVFNESFDFGNVQKQSFGKIWRNEKYVNARKASVGKEIQDKKLICYICKKNNAET